MVKRARTLVGLLLTLAAGYGVGGEGGRAWGLEPKEVAVLFNADDPQSLGVGEYYVHARGIPRENLIGITCSAAETIPESEYRTTVVPQVRKAIADHGLSGKVKCLVTVYGMPLSIGPQEVSAAQRAEVAADQKQLAETMQRLDEAAGLYDRIGASPATAASQPTRKPGEKVPWPELIQRLNIAASAAGRRVEAMQASERAHAMGQMEDMQRHVAGITGILLSFHVRDDAPDDDPGRVQLNAMQSQLNDINGQMQSLNKLPATAKTRGQIVALQFRARGWVGEAQQLLSTIQSLSADETESCFDNELSLVLEDQNYPRYRWLMNPKNVEFYPAARHVPGLRQPLMVTRLDGLTPGAVTQMIDTGLAVEKKGLEGKLYLDVRGMHGTDAYAVFDADIRAAADWLKSNSTIEVVLDDTPEFFEAKNSPAAALYCGWYSLHSYRDSCQWVPGAVGYHVASFEMGSLHKPDETGWVINLLKHGFCGTLGATSEPYLTAFPKPSKFFPLLLSGEFTQGEVWEVTAPMASWRMGYVGDPLYNPYKVKPRVKVETLKRDVVLQNAFTILRG